MPVPSLPRPRPTARAVVVALVAGAVALVPGTAYAHGRPAAPPAHGRPVGPPPRPVNHAPDRPVDVGTSNPWTDCSTSAPTPLRSTTPTLRAVLSDVDGGVLEAVFQVRDGRTKRPLWSATTAPQGSGVSHAVTVPEGVLRDGRTYEWSVQGRDAAGRKSPEVRCRVAVDATAPGPSQVTAVPGAGAVYAEDAVSGGVGVAGAFLLEAPGTDDVVGFLYAFDGGPARVDLEPGATAATVTWTPTTAGPHGLSVQAVDAAGNVGPERFYRFTVASASSSPTGNARWTLDEGAGTTATDATGGQVLTLSPSTTWTAGLQEELAAMTDGALLLDEADDGAATAAPLLDTTGSWSVAAFVRADGSAPGTVVSQDGEGTDAFRLGTGTVACEDGVDLCWSLSVAGADGAGGTTVTSTVPVVPGAWVALFAVRDAAQGTVRLDACSFGTVDEPGDQVPVEGATASAAAGVASTGPFRLGGAQDGASPWSGAISGVRTWGGVVDVAQERRLCSMGA
ncbi:LamG domain-containing protein [Cellulomonas flavigena DSM 20109]|uniref:LamG domain-containing protein n=1 Tax=Cellulomonas flavigena (strain ATCC 482 / DSM 20109 / BCRC 11376 / JCM 18109 / NBRC 3775 / NCIMB 8073 / NRS 134) TaxID=446466 RepID=D5UDC0_CELFN|nr:LamG-like jellyroll fold domain-containing protein [Cellulomonas flavigena]ADG76376.1 LamG domain-containing protein [Cellulomonas flavigena DSM 20109]